MRKSNFALRLQPSLMKELKRVVEDEEIRSLSDLTLIYCGKAGLGQISRSFSLNRPTIRLKRSKNLAPTGLSLATIG